jgi:anti-sigma factor RsiW
MSEHIGDSAALYALGALEPAEHARIDAHVAGCDACLRELGRAEEAVATLDDASLPRIEPPAELGRRLSASAAPQASRLVPRQAHVARWSMAAAACLIFITGLYGVALFRQSADLRAAVKGDDLAFATIATSHFKHESFVAREPGAPAAKVLYAPDGAWFYVVVDSGACACRVVAHSAAGERDLGAPQSRVTTSTLLIRDFPRPLSLDLVREGGSPIGGVSLKY